MLKLEKDGGTLPDVKRYDDHLDVFWKLL